MNFGPQIDIFGLPILVAQGFLYAHTQAEKGEIAPPEIHYITSSATVTMSSAKVGIISAVMVIMRIIFFRLH